jgi:phospholipid transport system substrate-binding protein
MMKMLGSIAAPLLAGLLAAAGGAALAADTTDAPANAPASDTADAMIKTASTDVLESIRADPAIKAGDFSHVQKLVEEKIMPHVDFDRITRHAVARAWHTATPEQQAKITEQFRILLLRTYAGALSRVTDHQVKMLPSRGQETNPKDAVVRTLIVPSNGDSIGIDYRLAKEDSGWKIYDLSILGIWLGENYRTEFASTVSQSGIDGLIKALTDKNNKLVASGGKSS